VSRKNGIGSESESRRLRADDSGIDARARARNRHRDRLTATRADMAHGLRSRPRAPAARFQAHRAHGRLHRRRVSRIRLANSADSYPGGKREWVADIHLSRTGARVASDARLLAVGIARWPRPTSGSPPAARSAVRRPMRDRRTRRGRAAPREHGLGGDRPPRAERAPDEGRHQKQP
jgi:hypothetical protein